MTPLKPVQADREAAARWAKCNSRAAQAANIRRGSCDTAPIVQAFARHRTESVAGLIEACRIAFQAIDSKLTDDLQWDFAEAKQTLRAALFQHTVDPAISMTGGGK